jgi:hypothetical protein
LIRQQNRKGTLTKAAKRFDGGDRDLNNRDRDTDPNVSNEYKSKKKKKKNLLTSINVFSQ